MIDLTKSIEIAIDIFGEVPKKVLVNPNVIFIKSIGSYNTIPIIYSDITDTAIIIM